MAPDSLKGLHHTHHAQSDDRPVPFDEDSGHVNAIIDTPKGSRNKFNYDEKLGMFRLGGALSLGAVLPFDFGYIPSTRGADGDPLDILILMDDPAFTGCLVPPRLIGVIEANQTEGQEEVPDILWHPVSRGGSSTAAKASSWTVLFTELLDDPI